MPDAGYATSSEAMTRAQVRLGEAAEGPAADAKKVAPTEITKEDFGRVHGQHHPKYKAGMDEIGAAMTGLSTALTNLGTNIGSAGTRYGNAETAGAAQAHKAGDR